MRLLVLNCGSSSVKFQLLETARNKTAAADLQIWLHARPARESPDSVPVVVAVNEVLLPC